MKKIDILGVTLKDYTLREALRLTDGYLNNGALNTIIYVSKKRLISAAESEEKKKWLEEADLTICGDIDLPDVSSTAGNRVKEIENNEYLKEFLKKITRSRYKVYLLADTNQRLEELRASLLVRQGGMEIAGSGILCLPWTPEDDSMLVNEINDVAPKVIISQLPFELQSGFITRNKMFVNADVILGLLEEGIQADKPGGIWRLTQYAYRKMFKRRVKKYNNQEKAE